MTSPCDHVSIGIKYLGILGRNNKVSVVIPWIFHVVQLGSWDMLRPSAFLWASPYYALKNSKKKYPTGWFSWRWLFQPISLSFMFHAFFGSLGGRWTSSYASYKLIAWVPGWNDPQPFHDLPRERTNNSELQRFWQSDHGHNLTCFDGTLPSVSSNYQICILVDEIWWYIPPVVGLTTSLARFTLW